MAQELHYDPSSDLNFCFMCGCPIMNETCGCTLPEMPLITSDERIDGKED